MSLDRLGRYDVLFAPGFLVPVRRVCHIGCRRNLGGPRMKALLTAVLAGALMLSDPHAWAAQNAGGLAKRITTARPATAEGARAVISLLHAALLQPPSQVSAEARGICGRYLPTALAGIKRGHVATCALQADGLEALATCAWLSGDTETAKKTLTTSLSLLDCPAEGVDGVRRSTRLAVSWLWPEAMEKIVFKQRSSLKGRSGTSTRSMRAAELNVTELAEARRRRKAIARALGTRDAGGLLVLTSRVGTSSAKAGLRPDDVIVLAGATPVLGLRQLRKLSAQGPRTPLTVSRRGALVQLMLLGGLEGLEALEVPLVKQSR